MPVGTGFAIKSVKDFILSTPGVFAEYLRIAA
jgi:hypothetical protein